MKSTKSQSSLVKNEKEYFTLKIVIPPNKSRLLYFKNKEDKESW